MKFNKKGAVTSDSVMKVVIGIIFIVAVAIPVTLNVVANTTLTGIGLVLLNLLPVFLAIAGIVLVAKLST